MRSYISRHSSCVRANLDVQVTGALPIGTQTRDEQGGDKRMLKSIQSYWAQKLRRWPVLLMRAQYSSAVSESSGGKSSYTERERDKTYI